MIPANDDASQSIDLIIDTAWDAIKEGLSDRKEKREKEEGDEKPISQKNRPIPEAVSFTHNLKSYPKA